MKTISFISGNIDSGKTSRLINFYNAQKPNEADGFASVKILDNKNDILGYALRRLSTAEEFVFIMNRDQYDHSFNNTFEFAQFIFSKDVFDYVENVIDTLLKDVEIKTLFLDEVGAVELQGMGFCDIFRQMLDSDKNLVVCVNDWNINAVKKKFGIHQVHSI